MARACVGAAAAVAATAAIIFFVASNTVYNYRKEDDGDDYCANDGRHVHKITSLFGSCDRLCYVDRYSVLVILVLAEQEIEDSGQSGNGNDRPDANVASPVTRPPS